MNGKKRKITVIVLAVLLGISLPMALYGAAAAVSGDSILLISKDYIDKVLMPTINKKDGDHDSKLAALETKYDALLAKYNALNEDFNDLLTEGTGGVTAVSGYRSVKIDAGKALHPAGENAQCIEVILQRGNAKVVFPIDTQGILDASDGKELMNGAAVPKGHFLIIPHANDGRAIAADGADVWVLVRGEYTIE